MIECKNYLDPQKNSLLSQEERSTVLKVLRYMEDPPLEVFQLVIKLLEGNPVLHRSKLAYNVFMGQKHTPEIKYKSVLRWLEERLKKAKDGVLKDQYEAINIRRVLHEQDIKENEKLPRDRRPALLLRH